MRRCDVHFTGWESRTEEYYYEQFRERDPISAWLTSPSSYFDSPVVTLSTLVAPRNMTRTAFFRELLRPEDLHHVLTIAIRHERRLLADFSIARRECWGDFTSDEINLALAVVPLLQRRFIDSLAMGSITSDTDLRSMEEHVSNQDRDLPKTFNLTLREEDIVSLVARGLSNKVVARRLGINSATVKNHLKSIFRKCSVSSRTELCATTLNRACRLVGQ